MAPGAARFKGTDAAWLFDVFIFCGNHGVSSRCCAWGQARSGAAADLRPMIPEKFKRLDGREFFSAGLGSPAPRQAGMPDATPAWNLTAFNVVAQLRHD
jgi:hypothetical protein